MSDHTVAGPHRATERQLQCMLSNERVCLTNSSPFEVGHQPQGVLLPGCDALRMGCRCTCYQARTVSHVTEMGGGLWLRGVSCAGMGYSER